MSIFFIRAFALDDWIEDLWVFISETINKATKKNYSSKLVSNQSKPYWTSELLSRSVTLRKALKSYLTYHLSAALAWQTDLTDCVGTLLDSCW